MNSNKIKNFHVNTSSKNPSHDVTSPNHHNTRLSSLNNSKNGSLCSNLQMVTKQCNQKQMSTNTVNIDKSTMNSCKNFAPLTVFLPNGSNNRLSIDSNENSTDSFTTVNSMPSQQPKFNDLVQISAPSLQNDKSSSGHKSTTKGIAVSKDIFQDVSSKTFITESSNISDNLLQPFEKATIIYRYMASLRKMGRNTPIFLQRNLSYMKLSDSRKHSKSNSKPKNLESIITHLTNDVQIKQKRQNFTPFVLKLLSFEEKPNEIDFNENVNFTISAGVKLINKFTNKPDQEMVLGEDIDLPLYSSNSNSPPSNSTRVNARNVSPIIHLSKDSLPLSDSKYLKSSLILNVKVESCPTNLAYSSPTTRSASANGVNPSISPRDTEAKKRKRSSALSPSASNSVPQTSSPKKDLASPSLQLLYRAEVPILNEHSLQVLQAGNYEIPMAKITKASPSDSITNGVHETFYGDENFDCEAKLHFECILVKSNSHSPKLSSNIRPNGSKNVPTSPCKMKESSTNTNATQQAVKIIYRFFLNQTDFQQTESTQTLSCPWCGINCSLLKQLAAHLKNCHERFNFRVRSESKPGSKVLEAIVDVVPNDSYDGSYTGNPYELAFSTAVGIAFSAKGPIRRNPTTSILVNKRGEFKELNKDSYEYLYDADIDNSRPAICGHDRLYYHSNSCLPIRPHDMDYDSESEFDPEWMRKKTQQVCISTNCVTL